MADDDKQSAAAPVKPASQPSEQGPAKQDRTAAEKIPDWQHALWKHAVDMKAWIRREIAHEAGGLSEKERTEKNP